MNNSSLRSQSDVIIGGGGSGGGSIHDQHHHTTSGVLQHAPAASLSSNVVVSHSGHLVGGDGSPSAMIFTTGQSSGKSSSGNIGRLQMIKLETAGNAFCGSFPSLSATSDTSELGGSGLHSSGHSLSHSSQQHHLSQSTSPVTVTITSGGGGGRHPHKRQRRSDSITVDQSSLNDDQQQQEDVNSWSTASDHSVVWSTADVAKVKSEVEAAYERHQQQQHESGSRGDVTDGSPPPMHGVGGLLSVGSAKQVTRDVGELLVTRFQIGCDPWSRSSQVLFYWLQLVLKLG